MAAQRRPLFGPSAALGPGGGRPAAPPYGQRPGGPWVWAAPRPAPACITILRSTLRLTLRTMRRADQAIAALLFSVYLGVNLGALLLYLAFRRYAVHARGLAGTVRLAIEPSPARNSAVSASAS